MESCFDLSRWLNYDRWVMLLLLNFQAEPVFELRVFIKSPPSPINIFSIHLHQAKVTLGNYDREEGRNLRNISPSVLTVM